jgi:hypothetical protein
MTQYALFFAESQPLKALVAGYVSMLSFEKTSLMQSIFSGAFISWLCRGKLEMEYEL